MIFFNGFLFSLFIYVCLLSAYFAGFRVGFWVIFGDKRDEAFVFVGFVF